MPNEDIALAIETSAAAAIKGDILTAFAAPILIGIAGALTRSGGTTISDLDPVKGALEMPFRHAARQIGLDVALLESRNARRRAAGIHIDTRAARVAMQKTQQVTRFISATPNDVLQAIVDAVAGGLLKAPQGDVFDRPEPLPGTEDQTMAESTPIQTAKYQVGLQNELNSEVRPAALRPGIQPVIEVGRFIPPLEIVKGNGVQFFSAGVAAAAVAILARIPGQGSQVGLRTEVHIRSCMASMVPQTGFANVRYNLRAYIGPVGFTTVATATRSVYQLTHDQAAVEADINVANLGGCIIGTNEDLIVTAQVISAGDSAIARGSFEAYRYPAGIGVIF